MLFAIASTDKAGAGELRVQMRESHRAYILESGGTVKLAGPFFSETGAMVGSLLIIDAADLAAAQQWAAADPYAKAGLFARSEIYAWRMSINNCGATL